MNLNFEKDIFIDEDALEQEWLEQAEKARQYGRYYAECRKRVALADEKVKVIRSELVKKANSNPLKYCNKASPNAGDIEAFYRRSPSHQKAKQELIEAQYELDMAEIAKNEIGYTRKTALENLVKLYGLGYFAGPKVPRNIHEERQKLLEDKTKEINKRIREKSRKRRIN